MHTPLPSLYDVLKAPFDQARDAAEAVMYGEHPPFLPLYVGTTFCAMPERNDPSICMITEGMVIAPPAVSAHDKLAQEAIMAPMKDTLVAGTLPLLQALCAHLPMLTGPHSSFTVTWHPRSSTQPDFSAHMAINGCSFGINGSQLATPSQALFALANRLEGVRGHQPATKLYAIEGMRVGGHTPQEIATWLHRCDPQAFPTRPLFTAFTRLPSLPKSPS